MSDKTFLNKKITNQDIYDKLVSHDQKFDAIKDRQDITNGKVKKALWMATTALSLIVMVIGIMLGK